MVHPLPQLNSWEVSNFAKQKLLYARACMYILVYAMSRVSKITNNG